MPFPLRSHTSDCRSANLFVSNSKGASFNCECALSLKSLHEVVQFGKRCAAFSEGKGAVFLHFPCGTQEGAEGYAGQSRTHADSARAGGGEVGCGQPIRPNQHVDWLGRHRCADRFDLVESAQTRRVKHVGACCCECRSATNGV